LKYAGASGFEVMSNVARTIANIMDVEDSTRRRPEDEHENSSQAT